MQARLRFGCTDRNRIDVVHARHQVSIALAKAHGGSATAGDGGDRSGLSPAPAPCLNRMPDQRTIG